MPKGDRKVLKADTEDGFTRIANLILEALSMVRINSTQTGICLFLMRRTYGWNRSQDAVSLGDFAAACGTSKTYVSRQLADLLQKKIIRRLTYEPGKTPVYAFCTNINEWDAGCINIQALADNDRCGLYECAPENCSDETNTEGCGLSDQTRVNDRGLSNQTSYGLSNRIRVGLSEPATPNQPQTITKPMISTALKTIRKTMKEKRIYSSDTLQYQLSELLLQKILEHLPGYKKPDLQKWATNMDLILRLDKRPPEEVKAVIIFAQGDPFWQPNILSIDKLRKHYDQLNLKRIQQRAGPVHIENKEKRKSVINDADEYERFFQ